MALRLVQVLTSVVLALLGGTHVFAAANDCDRACLKQAMDQYLAAVIKHEPSAAPLFVGFRQTENAVVSHDFETRSYFLSSS